MSTVLTGGRSTAKDLSPYEWVVEPTCVTGTIFYKGGMVGLNASGLSQPANSSDTAFVIGRALDDTRLADGITSGAAAAASTARIEQGVFVWANSGTNPVTAADIGHTLYVEDDQTVAKIGKIVAGRMVKLDSLGVHVLSGFAPSSSGIGAGIISVPLFGVISVSTGAMLLSPPSAAEPGTIFVGSKAAAVKWLAAATPAAFAASVPLPAALDLTRPLVVNALVSKSGATSGDATTLAISAFFQSPGTLYDAGTDQGGTTNALVGNATAKTTSLLTLSIAAANVVAPPASLTLTVKPTAGLLGTDSLFLHALYLTYG